ncbi:cation efflux protein, partial [Zopfochytrium polystomum]
SERKLRIALILVGVFFVVELVAGFLSGSLAILSDAFHLLSDIAGFSISLAAIHIVKQPATSKHSFGFARVEILGAIMSTALIWILTAYLVWEAIHRLADPTPIDAPMMLGTAIVGVIVNIVRNIEPGAHIYLDFLSRQKMDVNVRSAAIHVVGDLLSSIGVVIAALVILIKPSWTFVDPICTFLFSILVVWTTFSLMGNSLMVLMEATPVHIDPTQVEAALLEIPFVEGVHDLHIWSLTQSHVSMSVHLSISPLITTLDDYARILARAQQTLCDNFGIHHATIQIDPIRATASATSDSDEEDQARGRFFHDHCEPNMCQKL